MYLYLDTFKYVDTAGVQGSYNEKLGTFFSQKKYVSQLGNCFLKTMGTFFVIDHLSYRRKFFD